MCRRFPVAPCLETSERHPSKQHLSQDSIAKALADKHSADVVLSFSSLKHLLNCRALNSNTCWELPVTVASFPSTDATNYSAKRVFIDKAIPTGTWLSSRKNALYHKYGVKFQFTHFKSSKGMRKTQSLYQGTGEEKQQNREILDLQDGFFETENFVHETFGQISCSPEKKPSIHEDCIESEIKTFDAIHKSAEEERSAQSENTEKKHITVSDGGSLCIDGINNSKNAELNKDKSDKYSIYIDKENGLAVKDTSVTGKASVNSPIEKKCFHKISFVPASCQSNKDNVLNSVDTVKIKNSPDSLHDSLEQIKKSSPNTEDQKTSDESAFEESPKCKKRKIRTEPTAVFSGRRVTRSQTKKLEEDTLKQSKPSERFDFRQKDRKGNETIKTKQITESQHETTAQNSVEQEKHIVQHSETSAKLTEDLKTVHEEKTLNIEKENVSKETDLPESDFSNDSFPRSTPKRVKLLSTDDDSDDNLVIDENVLSADDKQKDLVKASNNTELNTSGSIGVNMLSDDELFHSDIPQKINTIQPEKTQPDSVDKAVSGENKLFSGDNKAIGSTLDQILHLQEEMLKPKHKFLNSPAEQKSQVSSGPQPGLPTYLEDASQFPSLDPSLNTNAQYSLWNMGQLKVIMRSRLDSRQLSSIPCFIFSKLEYQSQFGGEICSEQELLNQWITLLCHPGSVGLRARVDARTSKVLMTEQLKLPEMHNLIAKLSPEKPLCWIMDVFEKLKGLPNGQYLLGYQRKENVVTLYAATDGNKRGDFDLHTAIRQRLVALDDNNTGWQLPDSETQEVPWLPIDPDVMLPSLICRSRVPATFPPAKGSETTPKEKRKNPKKKSKKKSKIAKMKEKLQKT